MYSQAWSWCVYRSRHTAGGGVWLLLNWVSGPERAGERERGGRKKEGDDDRVGEKVLI